MQAWAFLPQVPRRKLRSTWYLAAPDRQALLEWAEVWSGVVWERQNGSGPVERSISEETKEEGAG